MSLLLYLNESELATVTTTIIHKIFETKRTTEKVQFLFFKRFLLVLTKLSFREKDEALRNNSMKFWDFPDISLFSKVLSLKSFSNSYSQFITNNHALFHLWWKENLLNHQKVSKYYVHGCSPPLACQYKFLVASIGTTAFQLITITSTLEHFLDYLILHYLFLLTIVTRNEKIVWKVVWIEYYLRLNLSCRRYYLVDTGREQNVLCTFNLRPVPTG